MRDIYKKFQSEITDGIILLLLVIAFYGMSLLPQHSFTPSSDALNLFLPTKVLFKNAILSGELPLWNPYTFMGAPFVATFLHGVFYPFNYFLLPFAKMSMALNYLTLFHLCLLALFMYLFLRHGLKVTRCGGIFGAIVLSCSGYIGARLDQLVIVEVITWMPLTLLCFVKFFETGKVPYVLGIALSVALQILPGHPQYTHYTLFFLGLYSLYYLFSPNIGTVGQRGKRFAVFILSIVLAVGISSVQILPSLAFAKQTVRALQGYDYAVTFSFPPKHLITLVLPKFFGTPATGYTGEWWFGELCCYIGLLPLLFVALSVSRIKKNRLVGFYIGLIVLLFLLAMGGYTPIFKFVYALVPGFKSYRAPSRFLIFVLLLLSSLAAIGFDFVWEQVNTSRGRKWSALVALLFIGFTFGDLYLFSRHQMYANPCDIRILDEKTPGWDYLSENARGYRVYRLMSEIDYTDYSSSSIYKRVRRMEPNFNILANVEIVYGYEEGLLPGLSYSNFMLSFYRNFFTPYLDADLLGLMNVKFAMVDKEIIGDDFVRVFPDSLDDSYGRYSYRIFENRKFREKFYWLSDIEDVYNLSLLKIHPENANELVPHQMTKVDIRRHEESPESKTPRNKAVKVFDISLNEYKITKEKSDEGEIVFSCNNSVGWFAKFDGKTVALTQMNNIMGKFYAPKGVETIRVVYAPASFKWGSIVSIFSILLLVVLFIRFRTKQV